MLLLEAGDIDAGAQNHPMADVMFNVGNPKVNRMYKTVPQRQLGGRQIDYSRGIGLGGSSVINFSFWTTGPKVDYDEWAAMVGDNSFNFENAQRLYRKIEKHDIASAGQGTQRVVMNSRAEDHGVDGAVDLQLLKREELEEGISMVMETIAEFGMKMNDDVNSGDPIGIGIGPPRTSKAGKRTTAYTAYLRDGPDNLTIKTNSAVARIVFDGSKAIGAVVGDEICKHDLI